MMKNWQRGYDLDYLKEIEAFYAPYNKFAVSPFSKFKKNNIAERLRTGTLQYLDYGKKIEAGLVVERAKVNSKIYMHGDTVIGEKKKGDVSFSRLCGGVYSLGLALDDHSHEPCWLFSWAADRYICELAEHHGFKKIGYKVSSFAEIMSVYYRDNKWGCGGPRVHPIVPPAELIGMAKIASVGSTLPLLILKKIEQKALKYTNHYSNYNTMNAWSALALRGYSADPAFITKPIEMNKKWKEEHKDEHYELQDTALYSEFPEVRELLSFLDGDVHRVRLMRLAPAGGELLKHTDQVDPDAGNSLGALARLHFPLKTNPKVLFSTWNGNDIEEKYHYGLGECWLIDTRKPHMAINGGAEERIHLVVDTIVTPKLEKMIAEGLIL